MSSTGGTGRPSCLKALKMPGAMSDTWNTPLTSPGWALRNVRVWVLAIVGSNLPTTVPTTLTLHAFIHGLATLEDAGVDRQTGDAVHDQHAALAVHGGEQAAGTEVPQLDRVGLQ